MNGRTEDTKVEAMLRGCETKGMRGRKNRLGSFDSQTAKWEEREGGGCDMLEPSREAGHQFPPLRQTGGVCQVN